ncbi:hypothetical protein DRW07_16875 [Alteromonas sediminis]|uniref:Uncharacterized protein n=1 Tax=Alteromonas sediminis TaxID=2259342 RepID=A0A3N5XX81_9ALTE|nr:polysialyltransferase family glycosyltransferase [Alteromonas sediminis]RPJ64993.1 hypothetical protein DRW07_16875 [Alteromonas sediminis]
MKALALVETPLQLLCVKEAADAMELTSVTVFVVSDLRSNSYTQLTKLRSWFRDFSSEKYQFVVADLSSVAGESLELRIGLYADLFNELDHDQFDRLLLCEYRSQWQKDIAATLSHIDTWLLDDGAATLCYLFFHVPAKKQFSLPQTGTEERQAEANRIKQSMNLSTGEPAKLSLFTMFHAHVPNSIVSQPNNLRCIYKLFDAVDSSSMVFIGTNMVELGMSTADQYHSIVKEIIQSTNKKVIYIPHRGQSKENNELFKSKFPTVEFLTLDMPLELWIHEQHKPPGHIVGFYSTAFYIANLAFPQINLTCIAFTQNMLDKAEETHVFGSNLFTNKEAFALAYDYLPEKVVRYESHLMQN